MLSDILTSEVLNSLDILANLLLSIQSMERFPIDGLRLSATASKSLEYSLWYSSVWDPIR